MRISDWSSDVCSSDLSFGHGGHRVHVQCTRQSKLEGDLVAYSLVLGRATDKDNAIHVLGAKLRLGHGFTHRQIGRAHVCTPVTNAHLVCRLLLEKKKIILLILN